MNRRYSFCATIGLIAAGVAYFAPVGQTQDSGAVSDAVVLASAGSGGPASIGAARSIDMATVPEATAAELAGAAARQTPRPQSGLTEEQHAARMAMVRSTDWASKEGAVYVDGPGVQPADSVEIATPGATKSFAGIGFTGLNPSDMGLAVGTQYVLQTVNSSVTMMTKTTGAVAAGFPKTLQAFLGRPAGAFVFDPRALYDWVKNRWIVVVDELEFGTGGRGFLNIAVSRTSNPTGLWAVYRIQMGGTGSCPDYPTLGQDRDIVYISANRFGCNSNGFTGPFQTSEVWLLPKKEMYAAAGFSFWFQNGFNVGGTQVDTLQPVNVQNKADRVRAEFMVNTFNINFGGGQCSGGCSGVVIWSISNPRGFVTGGPAPAFGGVIVGTATYALSPGMRTPSGFVDALDTRITGSVNYSAGRLYASTTTRVNTTPVTTSVLWWEFEPFLNDNGTGACVGAFLNKCPTISGAVLRQQDCYFCGGWAGNGTAAFGTLQPDPDNNVTMAFAWSNDATHPGIAYVSRRVTQALNTMHDAGIFLAAGQAPANTGGRWGDYYATAPDLASATQPYMWFSGMYARAGDGRWNTQIGRNAFTAINQP